MIAPKDIVQISRLSHVIIEQVVQGKIDPRATIRELQRISQRDLQPVYDWNPPHWWPGIQAQIDLIKRTLPGFDIPSPPSSFIPSSPSSVLLLHVPASLHAQFDRIKPPIGFNKEHSLLNEVSAGKKKIVSINGHVEPRLITWVEFDPMFGRGVPPVQLENEPDLAGSEVLSAMFQFPGWVEDWGIGSPRPHMSAYRIEDVEGNTVGVPAVCKNEGKGTIDLFQGQVDMSHRSWASPKAKNLTPMPAL